MRFIIILLRDPRHFIIIFIGINMFFFSPRQTVQVICMVLQNRIQVYFIFFRLKFFT